MRRISKYALPLVWPVLAAAAGCADNVPTLPDETRFPGGLPITIEHVVESDDLLIDSRVVVGGSTVNDVFFKLIANDFDDSLNAHLLAQFNEFPDEVVLDTGPVTDFEYENSWVVATLPDTLRTSVPDLEFQLWTVEQPWDSLDVTWENAANSPGEVVPWTVPGGTPGRLVSTAKWSRAATGVNADSLRWLLPSDVLTELAAGEIPGLMVTLLTPGARAEISSLAIEARARPEVRDTVVLQVVNSLAQTFVYTPEPELPPDEEVLRVGGITSDRIVLHLDLSSPVPNCPEDALPECEDTRQLNQVALNLADLTLDPLAVPLGFRPITPTRLTVRRVLQPELGDRAILGELVAEDTVSLSRFVSGGGEPVRLNVDQAVRAALARGDAALAIAILIEPEASTPSYAWFDPNVRLRLIYTLPQVPQLP